MKLMDISILNAITNSINGIDVGDCILLGRVEAYSCKMTGHDRKVQANLESQLQEQLVSPNGDKLSYSPFGPLTNRVSRQTLIYLISTLNCAFQDYDFTYEKSVTSWAFSSVSDLKVENYSHTIRSHLLFPLLSFLKFPRHFFQFNICAINAICDQLKRFLFHFTSAKDVDPFQFSREFSVTTVIRKINSILSIKVLSFTEEVKNKFWCAIDGEIQIQDCEVYSFIPDPDSDPFDEEDRTVWSINYFFYNRKLKRILFINCWAQLKTAEDNSDMIIEESYLSQSPGSYETMIYDEMQMES